MKLLLFIILLVNLTDCKKRYRWKFNESEAYGFNTEIDKVYCEGISLNEIDCKTVMADIGWNYFSENGALYLLPHYVENFESCLFMRFEAIKSIDFVAHRMRVYVPNETPMLTNPTLTRSATYKKCLLCSVLTSHGFVELDQSLVKDAEFNISKTANEYYCKAWKAKGKLKMFHPCWNPSITPKQYDTISWIVIIVGGILYFTLWVSAMNKYPPGYNKPNNDSIIVGLIILFLFLYGMTMGIIHLGLNYMLE